MLVAESRKLTWVEGLNPGVVEPYFALLGMIEGAKDVQECTFAGARFPDDAHDFTALHFEIDAFKDFELAERFVDVICL